jgi:RNA polymerase sigma factor (sigma-70 family)
VVTSPPALGPPVRNPRSYCYLNDRDFSFSPPSLGPQGVRPDRFGPVWRRNRGWGDRVDAMNSPRWRQGGDDVPSRDPQSEQGRARVLPLTPPDDSAYRDWDAAYLDNVGRLYRLMYAKVGNRPDAEDLTSEVFRAALGPLRLTASKGEVRAYLLATARTVLASHWRRRLGLEVTRIEPDADLGYATAPAPAADSDAGPRARQILTALPDHYRRVLELRFLEGCSIKESANALEVSVSNAKVLQHRALRMAARVAEELDQ